MDNLLNDFITVWSRYILVNHRVRRGYGVDGTALAALANLGQKNAIQSVMLFSNLIQFADKYVLLDIVSQQTAGDLDSDQIVYNFLTNVVKTSNTEREKSLFKELIAKHNKNLTSLFDMERLLEIKYAHRKSKHHEIMSLRKQLKERFEITPYNPEIAFSYGKNLTFFSPHLASNKSYKLGLEILSHLANREYSEELQAEIAELKAQLENKKQSDYEVCKKFIDDFFKNHYSTVRADDPILRD